MRLSVAPVTVSMAAPFVSSSGSVTTRELLFIELQTEDGPSGYGEAAPLPSYDGVNMDDVREALEDCRPLLAQSDGAANPGELIAACANAAVLPQAVAAIDLALWDLAGRRAGQPVWRLLGAQEPPPVQVNATIAASDRAGAASEAAAAAAAGFACLKAKVALGDAKIAHVTNIAIRDKKPLEFQKEWFEIDSDETPEGVAPDVHRYS